MIDLHSHILPGLDDGPQTLEESVAMVRLAAEKGTTDLVATPHASPQYGFQPELIEEKLAELALASGHVLRLHRGCDFHLYFENIQDALAHPARYTINHQRYLLVEFSDLAIAATAQEVFARLQEAGIIPVITHPERNLLLHQKLEQLRNWVEGGCLLQVTAQSFLGRFGARPRNFSRELMKRNLVHFVASDAHDSQDRTPRLDEAYAHIAEKFGEARAERLFVINPRAALAGDPLPAECEPADAGQRKWYQFWS